MCAFDLNLFDGLFWQNLHLVAPFSPMGFLLIFSTEVSEIVVGFFGSNDLPNTSGDIKMAELLQIVDQFLSSKHFFGW
jgi:hypothetical protein